MGCSDPNTVWEEYILDFGAKLGHNPRSPIQAMVQNWDLTVGVPFRLLDIDIKQKTGDKDINDDNTNYTNEKSDDERRNEHWAHILQQGSKLLENL